MDPPSSDEVDRDDPLLITTVKARLNREEKVKKVGRKTVKRLVSVKADDEEKTKEQQPFMVNPRRYVPPNLKFWLWILQCYCDHGL